MLNTYSRPRVRWNHAGFCFFEHKKTKQNTTQGENYKKDKTKRETQHKRRTKRKTKEKSETDSVRRVQRTIHGYTLLPCVLSLPPLHLRSSRRATAADYLLKRQMKGVYGVYLVVGNAYKTLFCAPPGNEPGGPMNHDEEQRQKTNRKKERKKSDSRVQTGTCFTASRILSNASALRASSCKAAPTSSSLAVRPRENPVSITLCEFPRGSASPFVSASTVFRHPGHPLPESPTRQTSSLNPLPALMRLPLRLGNLHQQVLILDRNPRRKRLHGVFKVRIQKNFPQGLNQSCTRRMQDIETTRFSLRGSRRRGHLVR